LHHVTIDVLRAGFFRLKKAAAPGIDGVLWEDYAGDLETNLGNLYERVHTGAYRALASRRRCIPKADGWLRPLGIAALEDKIVQAAVVTRGRPLDRDRGRDAPSAVISPFLGNVYLHYVYDLWVRRWRQRQAAGQIIRYADDTIVGFKHSQDAERFLSDLSTCAVWARSSSR
jgi:retron-type reverse transcriptase